VGENGGALREGRDTNDGSYKINTNFNLSLNKKNKKKAQFFFLNEIFWRSGIYKNQ